MEQQITDRFERAIQRGYEDRQAFPLARGTGRRRPLPPLGYVRLGERPSRRLPQLLGGLALYGFSLAVLVRAGLGVNPWSVLYEGLERHTALSFGTISAVVGVLVLLLWIPLRQRPTFGTLANIAVLACSSDLGLSLIPAHLPVAARWGLLVGGVLLNGLSVAVYVGARLGPGPRDGLMTGASAATGRSLRYVRTLIEVAVLVAGWSCGGGVGVGTVLYALAVGPTTQFFLPWCAYEAAGADAPDRARVQGAAVPRGGDVEGGGVPRGASLEGGGTGVSRGTAVPRGGNFQGAAVPRGGASSCAADAAGGADREAGPHGRPAASPAR